MGFFGKENIRYVSVHHYNVAVPVFAQGLLIQLIYMTLLTGVLSLPVI
jgi:hypothetical protein